MAFDIKARIYYDAEFTGLTKDTSLISVGFTTDDQNDYFYAEFNDYDDSKVDQWLQKHVIDNMIYNGHENARQVFNDSDNIITVMKGNKNEVQCALNKWLFDIHAKNDKQIQFYTDCYAYDWVLLNDLITNGKSALYIPKFIYYIPFDLSTLMQSKGIDPDINREEFAGTSEIQNLLDSEPFKTMATNKNVKHNSLWDAFVAKKCFQRIYSM